MSNLAKKRCMISLDIFFSIFLILSVASLTIVFIFSSNKIFFYSNVLDLNWRNGPISSITKNLPCFLNKDYLITDPWPGTNPGCINNGKIYIGPCGKYGKTLHSIPPMNFTSWRNTTICGTRESLSYLSLTIIEEGSSCPTSFKSCGVIDSLNNVLCVDSQDSCPFNYFEVVPNGGVIPSISDHIVVPVSGASLVFSNKNTTGKIINEFQLQESQPCADEYYRDYLVDPYLLEVYYGRDKCVATATGALYDSQWELKDSFQIFETYNENNITNTMNSAYPNYGPINIQMLTSNRNINLYHRNYIGLSVACHQQIKNLNLADLFIDILNNLTVVSKKINSNVLISLVISCVATAIYLIFSIFSMINYCSGNGKGLAKAQMIVSIPSAIIMVASFCINCVILSQIYSIPRNFIDIFKDPICRVDFSIIYLKNIGESINLIKIFSIISVVSTFLSFFIPFITFLLMCLKRN